MRYGYTPVEPFPPPLVRRPPASSSPAWSSRPPWPSVRSGWSVVAWRSPSRRLSPVWSSPGVGPPSIAARPPAGVSERPRPGPRAVPRAPIQHLRGELPGGACNNAIADRVDDLTTEIRTLRAEIAGLRKVEGELVQDIAERDVELLTLGNELANARRELRTLVGDEGEVFAMPRRGALKELKEETAPEWAALPTAEELWSDGDRPTVLDMKALVYPTPEQEQRKHA